MKKIFAVLLVLAGASLAIPQQAQRNASFDKLNVRNTATITGTLNSNNLAAGNVANKPASGDTIRFVTNNGNDANDGLSWGTAKLTIAAACASIANQDATCKLPLGVGSIYISDNFSGSYPSGFLTGLATALKIIGPGYIQADSSLTSAKGAVGSFQSESYNFLYDAGQIYAVQAGPRGPECFPITATSITANVLTVTCANNFSGVTTAWIGGTQESFLNGQTFAVASESGTQFTANFVHANYTNSTDSGVAVQQFTLAPVTLTLPDLTGGTATPSSGALLGITGATDAAAAGHCLYANGGTAPSGMSGLMKDSGFGCNQSINFPVPTRFVVWTNSANQVALTAVAATGNRTATLPDASGNVVLDTATQTLTNKTIGAYTPPVIYGTYRVTADFTLAANTSLQAITGLSWTMPANTALNVGFSCHLLYSQATAAVADQFGIQDVTVAPTSLMAKAQAYISASTFTAANVPALTTTTATPIVTFTPTAITTIWNADIDGMIEQPSNASTSVVQIMAQQSNSADLLTVKRGSFCRVW